MSDTITAYNHKELEHNYLLRLLREERGNIRQVSRRFGISRQAMYVKLNKLAIDYDAYRKKVQHG